MRQGLIIDSPDISPERMVRSRLPLGHDPSLRRQRELLDRPNSRVPLSMFRTEDPECL